MLPLRLRIKAFSRVLCARSLADGRGQIPKFRMQNGPNYWAQIGSARVKKRYFSFVLARTSGLFLYARSLANKGYLDSDLASI